MFVNRTDAVSRITPASSKHKFHCYVYSMVLTRSCILGGIAVVCRDLVDI